MRDAGLLVRATAQAEPFQSRHSLSTMPLISVTFLGSWSVTRTRMALTATGTGMAIALLS